MKLFVTGGVRSGKSRYALERAEALGPRRAFVATAEIWDEEMRLRVQRHQEERGPGWSSHEVPLEIDQYLDPERLGADVVLVDCLTLWLSNLLGTELDDEQILQRFDQLAAALDASAGPTIFVTNEVGFGIVPTSKLARRFRDLTGLLSQQLAKRCDEVVLMCAGLPMQLK